MDRCHIDFETRSVAELKKTGAYKYALHPTTQPWCLAWNFGRDGEESSLWRPDLDGWSCPLELKEHAERSGRFVAHNAPFEYAIWNYVLHVRYGWPRISFEQLDCTMSRAYAMALPGSLEFVAAALGLSVGKDKTGHNLMMKMAKPWQFDALGDPIWYDERPGLFTFQGDKVTGEWCLNRLGDYCRQDVKVEIEVDRRLLALTPWERRVWLTDMKINERGTHFDLAHAINAMEVRDQVVTAQDARLGEITGGRVEKTTALEPLKEWLFDTHLVLAPSLDKEKCEELLEDPAVPSGAKEAIKCRVTANRATSVRKLDTILSAEVDGRVKGSIQYSGAGTRRFTGRLHQPHNFPRDLPGPELVEELMAALETEDAEYIDLVYGDPLASVSQCLRGFITAAPGNTLMGADWSNVEGVGTAWLAGEQWKLDAFRECFADPDLPDMYKRAYAKAYRMDPRVVTDDQRQSGKVMELAFGYEGGVGAWRAFERGEPKSEDEVNELKTAWRMAHPAIAGDLDQPRRERGGLWREMERAAIAAVASPGIRATVAGEKITFRKAGSFLFMKLPGGGALCYPYPVLLENEWGDPMLTYKTVPSPTNKSIVHGKSNTKWWARVSTYGGKLTENAVQALCRDILVGALVECEENYLPVVTHTHDDIVVEGVFEDRHRRAFDAIMNTPPDWAPDFPLRADVWCATRYQKG